MSADQDEPIGYDGHGAPLYPHQLAVDETPPDYFAPAAADPAGVRRTRAELSLPPASPIRTYLERHRDQAAADRTIAEQRLDDATRDFTAVVDRQVTIQAALRELDTLEAEGRRLARIIVGPERTTTSPDTTQENP